MWTKRWQRREATSDLRVGGIARWLGAIALLAWVLSGATARAASEPKYGASSTLRRAIPQPSLSIHEEATVATVWPMMPCYNNLVLFDPLK